MESVSIFPPPPGYSALFSQEERNEANGSLEKGDNFALEPPEPADGQYVVFGELQEVVWLCLSSPVTQLFDEDADCRSELHRLHAEALKTYSELVETVITNPERYARLTERIGVLVRNMLQLVNLLRPHQVLTSMKEFLEKGLHARRAALEEIQDCKDMAAELLDKRLPTHRDEE